MAKVTVAFSASEAKALVKVLGAAKPSKTVEAITAKVVTAIGPVSA